MSTDDKRERLTPEQEMTLDAYHAAIMTRLNARAVAHVAGHPICPVVTRYGRLYEVGRTGRTFLTLDEAAAYAETRPPCPGVV